jgi:hypothetical protein
VIYNSGAPIAAVSPAVLMAASAGISAAIRLAWSGMFPPCIELRSYLTPKQTTQGQRTDAKSNFVLHWGHGQPNVQTLSLKPGLAQKYNKIIIISKKKPGNDAKSPARHGW